MMKRPLTTILFCALAAPALADDADTYPHCSYTPASAIGPMFDTKTAAECETACKDNAGEGCTAWSYMTPSDMFPDNPGKCRMIKEVWKEEESDRFRCGKI